jgi:hypothetical protein
MVMTYNTMTDTWTDDSLMIEPRDHPAMAIMRTTATATAATTQSMNNNRSRSDLSMMMATTKQGEDSVAAAAAAAVAMVYAFSGMDGGDTCDTCEVYNCETRTWTPLTAKIHVPRWAAAAIYIPHWRAFIICGGQVPCGRDEADLDSIEVYSPATNTFTLLTDRQWQLPRAMSGPSLQLHDNILIVINPHIYKASTTGGWAIDLSLYATIDHVINTRTPLAWHALPSPPPGNDRYNYLGNSSFIV